MYFLDNVYFEIISNDDENNCDGNETSYVANKLSSVNDTNDRSNQIKYAGKCIDGLFKLKIFIIYLLL